MFTVCAVRKVPAATENIGAAVVAAGPGAATWDVIPVEHPAIIKKAKLEPLART
jgi:hypothetical protein